MLAVMLLLLVAALNLVPVAIAFAPLRAVRLYGLDEAVMRDPSARVLLRHRALFFGLVSVWLTLAAWAPAYRTLVIASTLVLKASFLALYAGEAGARKPLARIARADVIAATMLVLAWLVTDSPA